MVHFLIISLVLNFAFLFLIIYLKWKTAYYLRDKFTSAYNYFFFDVNFSRYLKPGNHFLFIDIDNFKKQNIELGYDIADHLLKLFIDKLKKILPCQSIIIRYKLGDEFVIILPKTNIEGAKDIIFKLKSFKDQFDFQINEKLIHLDFTISETTYLNGDISQTVLDRLVHSNFDLKNERV